MDEKRCTKCGEVKPLSEMRGKYKTRCLTCKRRYDAWKQVQYRYGITKKDYEAIYEKQGGVCAICGGVNKNGVRLHIDHNHESGEVRGLLCGRCNNALQLIFDDFLVAYRMANYLKTSIIVPLATQSQMAVLP